METVEKRSVMKRPSEEAVKLANSIYFTSIQGRESYLYLSLKQLCNILDNCTEKDWFAKGKITDLLEELSEPVAVENFTYNRKHIEWQAMSFLSYEFCVEDDQDYVDIELNEMFIEVMKQLEAEPYINFQ